MTSDMIVEPHTSERRYSLIYVSDKELDYVHTHELSEIQEQLNEEKPADYFLNFGTPPTTFADLLGPDTESTGRGAGSAKTGPIMRNAVQQDAKLPERRTELHMWGPKPDDPPPNQWHLLFGIGQVVRHFSGQISDLLCAWEQNSSDTRHLLVYGSKGADIGEYLWPGSTACTRKRVRTLLKQTRAEVPEVPGPESLAGM